MANQQGNQSPPAPSRRQRIGTRVAATLIAIFLMFSVAEVGARLFGPDIGVLVRLFEETDDPRPYVLKPNVEIEFSGLREPLGRAIIWQVNSQGLRDDRDIGARGDRFRIATYGDSEAFGWSVALEETFQHQMEAMDDRIEVLNLAVPGYNVADSNEHMERTLAAFDPDLVIFLATQNDFDESLEIDTIYGKARVLMWARLLYQVWMTPQREALRRSPERKQFFADHIDRMIRLCERHGVPLIIGFAKWENRQDLMDHLRPASWLATHPDGRGDDGFTVRLVDVGRVTHETPQVDDHLTVAAYKVAAELFCRVISEEIEAPEQSPGDRGRVMTGGADPPVESCVLSQQGAELRQTR